MTKYGRGISPWPKVCSICGEKIKITGFPALVFHFDHETGVSTSTHVACKRAA